MNCLGLNSDLERQETTFHPKVCADVFVNRPGEFIVQLPGLKSHYHRKERNNARYREQVWPDNRPDRVTGGDISMCKEPVDRLLNLIVLNGCVNKHATVVQA